MTYRGSWRRSSRIVSGLNRVARKDARRTTAPIESKSHCQNMSCTDCWNREMPEDAETPFMRGYNTPPDDPVNHPSHYTAGGIECIDAIAAALTCQKDPMEAWLTGQVLKYLCRWPLKNGKEDLEKARWYLDRLIGKVGEQA